MLSGNCPLANQTRIMEINILKRQNVHILHQTQLYIFIKYIYVNIKMNKLKYKKGYTLKRINAFIN